MTCRRFLYPANADTEISARSFLDGVNRGRETGVVRAA